MTVIRKNPNSAYQRALILQEREDELNAKILLAETDWMIIRFLETGQPVSKEVSDARAQARKAIKK